MNSFGSVALLSTHWLCRVLQKLVPGPMDLPPCHPATAATLKEYLTLVSRISEGAKCSFCIPPWDCYEMFLWLPKANRIVINVYVFKNSPFVVQTTVIIGCDRGRRSYTLAKVANVRTISMTQMQSSVSLAAGHIWVLERMAFSLSGKKRHGDLSGLLPINVESVRSSPVCQIPF